MRLNIFTFLMIVLLVSCVTKLDEPEMDITETVKSCSGRIKVKVFIIGARCQRFKSSTTLLWLWSE